MVAVANVFPVGLGVVPLQRGLLELTWQSSSEFLPEPLGGFNIGSLMDVDAERQIVRLNPRGGQEAQEEEDQPRVAVDEDNPLKVVRKLPLRAFTPVGDCPSDQDLTLGHLTYVRGCGSHLTSPQDFSYFTLFCPVPAHAFGGSASVLGVAQPRRAGEVADPEGD